MNGSTDRLIDHGVHRERVACKAGSPSVAINGNTHFLLLIDQVLQTPLFEFIELGCVKIENFGVSEFIPDSLQHCFIAQQSAKIAGLPLILEQTAQRERDLKTGADRFELVSVNDLDTDTPAQLAIEFAGRGCEFQWHEQYTRQVQSVQFQGQHLGTEPGGSQHFKRRVGAAPDRQVSGFEQANSGIKNGFGQAAHIGRRINPWQAGGIKIVTATPALEWNNLQIEIRFQFSFEHTGQFADSHTMTHRKPVKTDKGLFTLNQHGAADGEAVDRVGPVENNKTDPVFGCGLHGIAHGRNIGVKAGADILNVKYQCIDTFQHLGRGPVGCSVQTVDLNTGERIFAVTDLGLIQLAEKTMLRVKKSNQLDVTCRVEELNVSDTQAIDTGLVGNQADFAAGELSEAIPFKYIDTCQHYTSRGGGGIQTPGYHGLGRRVNSKQGQNRAYAKRKERRFQHTDYKHDRFH